MTDATEIKAAVERCSVENALLAILHALVETGRTPDEIRTGWDTVARTMNYREGEIICIRCGERQEEERGNDILF